MHLTNCIRLNTWASVGANGLFSGGVIIFGLFSSFSGFYKWEEFGFCKLQCPVVGRVSVESSRSPVYQPFIFVAVDPPHRLIRALCLCEYVCI